MRTLAILVLAAASAPVFAGGVVELEAPPGVSYRVARDIDGDGICDLLLVTPKEVDFFKGGPGGLRAHCDARMALPKDSCLFDLAPRASGKGRTVVVRTPEGYFALVAGKPPRRLKTRSGPGLPAASASILWRLLSSDLDGDGAEDYVDVSREGYRIDYAGGTSVLLPPALRETTDTQASFLSERRIARYAFGMWAQGDFDGDGRPDFAVAEKGGLAVYPGDAAGRSAPDRHFFLDFPAADNSDLTFVDLNGDGRTDALAVDRAEGRATIFLADKARGLRAPRSTRLSVRGTLRDAVLVDLDGDGLLDLALPYFPTPSVEDAVRWFVRGEVLIEVPVFLNRGGDRCIPRLADRQVEIPVKIRVKSDLAGRFSVTGLVVVEYEGDLDGDGRKDLVVSERPDLLAVYPGVKEGVFAEKPSRRIPVPDASPFESVASTAADFDGDGKDDLLLQYRGGGARPDRVFYVPCGKE